MKYARENGIMKVLQRRGHVKIDLIAVEISLCHSERTVISYKIVSPEHAQDKFLEKKIVKNVSIGTVIRIILNSQIVRKCFDKDSYPYENQKTR